MKDIASRGIYLATLGFMIAALSIGVLIWGPGNQISDAIAFMLVAMTVLGAGLVITGAAAALREPGATKQQRNID